VNVPTTLTIPTVSTEVVSEEQRQGAVQLQTPRQTSKPPSYDDVFPITESCTAEPPSYMQAVQNERENVLNTIWTVRE
jgi:hypothetical protein